MSGERIGRGSASFALRVSFSDSGTILGEHNDGGGATGRRRIEAALFASRKSLAEASEAELKRSALGCLGLHRRSPHLQRWRA